MRTFTLMWHHHAVHMQIRVTVDLRIEFWPSIHVEDVFNSDLPAEGVTAEIVRTANNRDRFLCPLTNRPADTLFLREGVLGSRAGLNLGYSSQLSAHRAANAKHGRKQLDEERFRSSLRKYGIRQEQFLPARPVEHWREEFLKQCYELRYSLAMKGYLPAMMSYWKEYGIWDEAIEAPAILEGESRQAFLDDLSALRKYSSTCAR